MVQWALISKAITKITDSIMMIAESTRAAIINAFVNIMFLLFVYLIFIWSCLDTISSCFGSIADFNHIRSRKPNRRLKADLHILVYRADVNRIGFANLRAIYCKGCTEMRFLDIRKRK